MKVLLKRYVMIAALWSTTLTATANDNGTSLVAFAGQASSDSVCDATEQAGLSGCHDSGSIYGLGISHRMQNLGFDASVLRMSAFDAGSDSNPVILFTGPPSVVQREGVSASQPITPPDYWPSSIGNL